MDKKLSLFGCSNCEILDPIAEEEAQERLEDAVASSYEHLVSGVLTPKNGKLGGLHKYLKAEEFEFTDKDAREVVIHGDVEESDPDYGMAFLQFILPYVDRGLIVISVDGSENYLYRIADDDWERVPLKKCNDSAGSFEEWRLRKEPSVAEKQQMILADAMKAGGWDE